MDEREAVARAHHPHRGQEGARDQRVVAQQHACRRAAEHRREDAQAQRQVAGAQAALFDVQRQSTLPGVAVGVNVNTGALPGQFVALVVTENAPFVTASEKSSTYFESTAGSLKPACASVVGSTLLLR